MRRREFLVAVPVAARRFAVAASEVAASEAEVVEVAVVVKIAAFAVHQPQCEAATASDGLLNNFRIIRHRDISTKTSYLVCSNTSQR